jgi:hypothetical protein
MIPGPAILLGGRGGKTKHGTMPSRDRANGVTSRTHPVSSSTVVRSAPDTVQLWTPDGQPTQQESGKCIILDREIRNGSFAISCSLVFPRCRLLCAIPKDNSHSPGILCSSTLTSRSHRVCGFHLLKDAAQMLRPLSQPATVLCQKLLPNFGHGHISNISSSFYGKR